MELFRNGGIDMEYTITFKINSDTPIGRETEIISESFKKQMGYAYQDMGKHVGIIETTVTHEKQVEGVAISGL